MEERKIDIEKLSALYFDEEALKVRPEEIYRLDKGGYRYYYKYTDKGEVLFFTSVTTMIKNTLPTSPFLIEWIANKGYEESKRYAKDKANYGTFLHMEIEKLLIDGEINLDETGDRVKAYIQDNLLDNSFLDYVDEIKKDVLSFSKFAIDHNIKPLAIEIILSHPNDGYAGAIDLVCTLHKKEKGYWGEKYKSNGKENKKGDPKETTKEIQIKAIIDFKSGKKGFYESSEIQLSAYREMWNLKYPDNKVDRIFNWSPKEWVSSPSYNFTEQTGSKSINKLKHLVDINRIEESKKKNNVTIIGGQISLKRKDLSVNIKKVSLSDFILNKD